MGSDARQVREAFEHLSQACMSCIFFDFRVILFSASLQECGDGAAAKESLRDLGYDGLHVAIRGGFLSLLKDIWFQEHKYSSVTLVWAGNDLTSRWGTPDTFTHAVEEAMAFGQRYGVPIRLVDVVGERYQRR